MQTRSREIYLEVERKFPCLQVYPLAADSGDPPFSSLQHLGFKTFCDTYFDEQGLLSQAGTWVRQRDGQWQSKVQQAGDANDSQFRETQDLEEIRDQVELVTKKSAAPSEAFGLSQIAKFVTHREMWKADDRFNIVLDRTDFGHVVGEVELEATISIQSDDEAKKHGDIMNAEVVAFMQRYSWAFASNSATGKLTAYFEHQKLNTVDQDE